MTSAGGLADGEGMLNLKPFQPFYYHLRKVRGVYIIGVLAGVVYGVTSGALLPLMLKVIFPLLFGEGESEPDEDDGKTVRWMKETLNRWVAETFESPQEGFLLVVCLFIPVVMGIRALSGFINGYFMTHAGVKVSQFVQKDVFDKINSLPLSFYQRYKSGDLNSRILADPLAVRTVIVDVSDGLIKHPITLISALGYLISEAIHSQGVLIALAGAISIPLTIYPIKLVGKHVKRKGKVLAEENAKNNTDVIEFVQSPMEIKSYNLQAQQSQRFSARIQSIFKLTIRQTMYRLMTSPAVDVVASAGFAVTIYLGVRAGMGLGEFTGLFGALYMSYEPIKKIGNINNKISTAEASVLRIRAVLEMENSVPDTAQPVALAQPLSGKLEFRNVGFTYDGAQSPALSGINVTTQPGDIIALVGHSGAGKTSFANLVPRFYDPSEGAILADGVDLRDLASEELRQHIGLVPQSPALFNASIRENIRLGKMDATDEEITIAAQKAYAHEFILEQEDGYDTLVGERGSALSGGQRQRIALARAFLKDAPILILDEATSALDNDSEDMIQQALQALSAGRTVFMIAHRFSSLKNATRTFYFHEGRLQATGTHEELYQSEPGYKALYDKSAQ